MHVTTSPPDYGHEHRKAVTRALTGVYVGLEHRADPDSTGRQIMTRALQRAARAYDGLAVAHVGQLLPNTLGKAVLVVGPSD